MSFCKELNSEESFNRRYKRRFKRRFKREMSDNNFVKVSRCNYTDRCLFGYYYNVRMIKPIHRLAERYGNDIHKV